MTAIVVAVDFAEMTDYVLAEGIREASELENAEVHVVCAIDPGLAVTDLEIALDFTDELGKLERVTGAEDI